MSYISRKKCNFAVCIYYTYNAAKKLGTYHPCHAVNEHVFDTLDVYLAS